MTDSILKKFTEGFKDGYFIRIGLKEHNIFIGKDEEGRFCFEYRGVFNPIKIVGSTPLIVNQYNYEGNIKILRFSLEHDELIGCFSAFCEDLLYSVNSITDDNIIYKTMASRYLEWKKLFKTKPAVLTEFEIMGLIAELLFLKNKAFDLWGIDAALDSWTGPEKTHKDFSYGNEWYEIKSISSGKENVKISSIEQLDSDIEGNLCIYSFEKMSPSYNGVKLNSLAREIMSKLNTAQRDLFLNKLELFDFNFEPSNDNYVYVITDISTYSVTKDFPRLRRTEVPLAISKAQYEIIISEIIPFKKQNI